jgi:hypothetical protein
VPIGAIAARKTGGIVYPAATVRWKNITPLEELNQFSVDA